MIDFFLTSWVFWALLSSFGVALMYIFLEFAPFTPRQYIFWRGIGTALVLMPLFGVIPLNANLSFFLYLIIISLLAIYADIRMYYITDTFGSGISTRIVPIVVFFSFIGTLIVTPSIIDRYIAHPKIALGIITCILVSVYAALQIRKCDISRQAYFHALPVFFIYAINNLLAKEALSHADVNGSYYYALFQGWIIGLGSLFFYTPSNNTPKSALFSPSKILGLGLLLGVFVAFNMVSRNFSFYYTDNISYPLSISLLAPFWVLLFYAAIKRKENNALIPGITIVLSAIALVLLTGQLTP